MPSAQEIIAALRLEPHPIEGGILSGNVQVQRVRERGGAAPRLLASDAQKPGYLDLLLADAQHVLGAASPAYRGDLHLYLGGPLRMLQLSDGGVSREILIGTDLLAGQEPQVVVPAGVWQGSMVEPGVEFALLGATMAPGFDYADYEQGSRSELLAQYPSHWAMITRLTRR